MPERCQLKGLALFANHETFSEGVFNELEIYLTHNDQDRLATVFEVNYVYGPPARVYYQPEIDIQYDVGKWYEFVFDTPFVYNGEESLLVEFRYNGCNSHTLRNLAWFPGNSSRVLDGYLGQTSGFPRDMMIAFRFTYTPLTTVSSQMSCTPFRGTLPFTSTMTVNLVNNLEDQARTAAGHIDLSLGNGVNYANWRSGWVDLDPAGWTHQSWNQQIPSHFAFRGNSEWRLVVEDVTPAPYNQPPYLASGDISSRVCTIIGSTE